MRVVVVSDTHVPRFAHRLPLALAHVAAARPERIVHCGDLTALGVIDALARIAPVDAIAGNNDGPEVVARFGRRAMLDFDGVRVGLVHGDGDAGTTLERARRAFAHERVDAIFFGHSHVPACLREGDRWLVNPGSPTDKRRERTYSFAVVEIDVAARTLAPRIRRFEA